MDLFLPYASMLVLAFGAGTLLPFSSEVALVAAMKATSASTVGLVAFATVGNVAGSVFNWWVGRSARRFEGRRWFPFDRPQIDRASARFQKLGLWSLVMSWLPVVGDPLTFVAGVLRVPLPIFLALVTIGRLGRYIVVATSASAML
jgi:membrane protein YqaA with SNARE-associated domain